MAEIKQSPRGMVLTATAREARRRFNYILGLIVLLAGSGLNSGCFLSDWAHNGFKVGPNYAKPPAPVASEWIDFRDGRIKSEPADLSAWWQVFGDPNLNNLIETAYRQNITLRVAGARILEAAAQRGIAAGNLFPQLQDAAGSYSTNKLSSLAANAPATLWFPNWGGGFNLAWELDFWGRFRRALESADDTLDASVENYDDVLVILLSDVATNYIQYRTFQERLTYARHNIEIQEKSFNLAQERFGAGATTERDVQQAKQILEQTRALLPQLEIGVRQANNALCVLLGMPVRDLGEFLGRQGSIPPTPDQAVVGIPADLLRRRPDVRRAERQAAAQCANIGVAAADFYPRISLVGTIGLQAEQFAGLFHTPGSMVGSVGPAFEWAILNYGRILNGVRLQDAQFQELAYNYQNVVLQADREAEDAIVAFLKTQEQEASLTASVAAASRTIEITVEQYRLGAIDFTPLFLFESQLTDQQDQQAATRGSIALSLIQLYRAVGGGWEIRLQGQPLAASQAAQSPTARFASAEEVNPGVPSASAAGKDWPTAVSPRATLRVQAAGGN